MKDIAPTRYADDLVAWSREQAAILRARDFSAVDWANVIEEIESVGASERRSLGSALALILEHRIKLDYGKARDPERGWRITIAEQQAQAERILEDNPSLRREVPELIAKEYPRARRVAMKGFAEYEPERVGDYEKAVPLACPYEETEVFE